MSPSLLLVGGDWHLTWTPSGIHGTPRVLAAVRAYLAAAGSTVAYSPVGPYLPAAETEPLAVLAALAHVAPSAYELTNDGVDLSAADVPEGAVS